MSDETTDHGAGPGDNAPTANAPTASDAGGSADPAARKLDTMSRTSIESRLRSMYDEVAAEPVPDRFLQLLDKLERSEGGSGAAGGAGMGGTKMGGMGGGGAGGASGGDAR